ncbi:CHAT domain-containing protein [uncultured Duncaniella sp.]|uniref:CHAT domain-containing protein n=1 Tax=uncultured Duncaniella sp. TaxID=2768039 RepID=UPI0026318719|nr:CHAT domain-containing protein [uncultured Duncaniella sp.]
MIKKQFIRLLLLVFAFVCISGLADAKSESKGLFHTNRYYNQIDSLTKQMQLYESINIFDSEAFLESVFKLDSIYMSFDDIYSSEKLLNHAIGIINDRGSDRFSKSIALLYLKLGRNQMELKSPNDAIMYFLTAKNTLEIMGCRDSDYIVLLNNIASAYCETQNYFLAKLYIDELMFQQSMYNGGELPIIDSGNLMQFSNYAHIYSLIGEVDIAEEVFKKVVNTSLNDEKAYSYACNNYAFLLITQNRIIDAINCLEKVKYNYHCLDITSNLSLAYYLNKDYKQAIIAAQKYRDETINNVLNVISNFAQSDWELYWNSEAKKILYLVNSICAKPASKKSLELGFNTTLFSKSFMTAMPNFTREAIKNANNSKLMDAYDSYCYMRDRLSTDKHLASDASFIRDLSANEDALANSISDVYRDIIHRMGDYNGIKKSLSKNEAAIEFCYSVDVSSYPSISVNYGAYIIREDKESPIFVKLSDYDTTNNVINEMTRDELMINQLYSLANHRIYDLIWSKIEPSLSDISTVYYSPINMLSYINYDMISDKNGCRYSDKYKLRRVSSTNQIGRIKSNINSTDYSSAVLYGGINYDTESYCYNSDTDLNQKVVLSENMLILRSMYQRGKFGDLPETNKEVKTIANLFEQHNISYKLYSDRDATEVSFKFLNHISPSIIHLATHGFSIQNEEQLDTTGYISLLTPWTPNEKYMNWSGLLLAGAHKAWENNNIQMNDGILTSSEISRLDLSTTDLVVLSACDTGKGVIDEINGVIGLQQAFKMAGVKTILMSLWPVPDKTTSILMTNFYNELLRGIEIHEALNKAVDNVRKLYPDPYYWSAFVLLD